MTSQLISVEISYTVPASVKKLLAVLLALCASAPVYGDQESPAKRPFVLYAQMTSETQVVLSNGSKWVMDKGDCFPIYMFKDHQTKVILKLGDATFTVDARRVHVLKESDGPTASKNYQKNLVQFEKPHSEKTEASSSNDSQGASTLEDAGQTGDKN